MSKQVDVDFNGFGAAAIIILFWLFWMQSGWYRLDCSLGVQKACELISQEYAKKERP